MHLSWVAISKKLLRGLKSEIQGEEDFSCLGMTKRSVKELYLNKNARHLPGI